MKACKKCLTFALAALICLFSAVTVCAEIDNFINADWDKEYIDGDVNGDETVSPDDIVLVRQYVAGLISDNDIVFDAADLNSDGSVTPDDLVILRKMVAGLI